MPADRHQRKKARTSAPSANAEAGPSSGPGFKVLPLEQRGADALPGVNKLKASLRQARRLLNKVGEMAPAAMEFGVCSFAGGIMS